MPSLAARVAEPCITGCSITNHFSEGQVVAGESPSAMTVTSLSKVFNGGSSGGGNSAIHALNNVSLSLIHGKTMAVVGESGSGKSTLAKLIMRLEKETSGRIDISTVDGFKSIDTLDSKTYYSRVQMVFQDPYSSLNPRKKIWQIVSAPRRNIEHLNARQSKALSEEYLTRVGLGNQYLDVYPHNLSGGQRQRVGIARALIGNPEILVLDEPLSSLDISIQAQVVNLLLELQQDLGLTYLFISHDLSIVRHIADSVAVMYAGNMVECGTVEDIIAHPLHPYTKSLVASSLNLEMINETDVGVVNPDIEKRVNGCRFASRCSRRLPRCLTDDPVAEKISNRIVSCFNPNTDTDV